MEFNALYCSWLNLFFALDYSWPDEYAWHQFVNYFYSCFILFHLPLKNLKLSKLHGKFDCMFSQPKYYDTVSNSEISKSATTTGVAPQKFLSEQPPLEDQLHVFPSKLYDNIPHTFLVPNYPTLFTGLGCDKAFCGAYWCSQGVNSSHCNLICNQDIFKSVSYSLIFVKPHYTFDHHTQCRVMSWMQIV